MNPGWSGTPGASARRATSRPATTDCHRKRGTSISAAMIRSPGTPGGSSRTLAHAARAAVGTPTARSRGWIPIRTTHNAK